MSIDKITETGLYASSRNSIKAGVILLIMGLIPTILTICITKTLLDGRVLQINDTVTIMVDSNVFLWLILLMVISICSVALGVSQLVCGAISKTRDYSGGKKRLSSVVQSFGQDQYVAFIESSKNCPSCGAELGEVNPKFCPECGHQFGTLGNGELY